MKHESKSTLVLMFYHETSSAEEQRGREHLAACAPCRGYFEEVQRMAARLSQWPEQKPLPDTFGRILANLPQTQPRPRAVQPAFSFKPILGIAFALFGIVLVLFWAQSKISALPLWPVYERHWLAQTLGSAGLALALFFALGTFITLALAPALYFGAHKNALRA
jgi:predicted anti-sigma-YlaC factor YlaD